MFSGVNFIKFSLTQANPHVHLSDLAQNNKLIAEHIWIDGALDIPSWSLTLIIKSRSVANVSKWNYDYLSCYQAPTQNSEVYMKQAAYLLALFHRGYNILVSI